MIFICLAAMALVLYCFKKKTESAVGQSSSTSAKAETTQEKQQSVPVEIASEILTIDLAEGVLLKMVKVSAAGASFQMGEGYNSKATVHTVSFKNDYYIGQYEVTQAQWDTMMESNPSRFRGGTLPVEFTIWDEVMEFCRKLNESGKAPDSWLFTLPTEAQWEFAAKGGKESKGYRYSGSDELEDVAWYNDNSGDVNLKGMTKNREYWLLWEKNNHRTHPVGQKKPNELGLFDMNGNVKEMCLDVIDFDNSKYSDGDTAVFESQTTIKDTRVIRDVGYLGGAGAGFCTERSYMSTQGGHGNRTPVHGFRLALVQVPKKNGGAIPGDVSRGGDDHRGMKADLSRNIPKKSVAPAQERKTEIGSVENQDIFADVFFGNKESNGNVAIELHNRINDVARRVEVNLQPLDAVRIKSIDAYHSCADLDFSLVDEYSKIIRFLAEVEKVTPRLSLRLVHEFGIYPVRAVDSQQKGAALMSDTKMFRLTGQFRVITYTPVKNEFELPPIASASSGEKQKSEEPLSAGDTSFLTKLHDLSLVLPDNVFVNSFRLSNDGTVTLSILTQERNTDFRHMIFHYWRVFRIQMKPTSDKLFAFTLILAKTESPPQPQQDSESLKNIVETMVARNIFDPDRISKKDANQVISVAQTSTKGMSASNEKSPTTELEQQLQEALKNRDELDSMLQVLNQTHGVTNEQIELIHQHLEQSKQQIKHLREQQKEPPP